MKLRFKRTICDYFSDIKDPRLERRKRHKLIDIITITICAIISGVQQWTEIEAYGQAKSKWFKKMLELPNGIPSHDTFSRVFQILDPEELRKGFLKWVQSVYEITEGEIVPIDGKTLKGSSDMTNDQKAIHMVSAWASKNRLVLGQIKVDKKSNEITAIPTLLKLLKLKGCIVTIDAMGCQRKIVDEIVKQEADYLITVKKNQSSLYKILEELFKPTLNSKNLPPNAQVDCEDNWDHGRDERRDVTVLNNIQPVTDLSSKWKNLKSIIKVEYVQFDSKGKMKYNRRYFISSLLLDAKSFAKIIRTHWTIENQMNWVLDVQLGEDASRIRKGHSPENLAIIRHLALSLINQETTLKKSVKGKQNKAGWDNNYLSKILAI
ncbi:transposase ISAs1 family protein (plasmid) [Gloeothece citriformis PCC 7424]|uniref:Transposase ISAs1 family protein n=1 Tax=Gloeothece citriformis (strain PCC 7424) TaxID=65393 RepID=B7KKF6_GLOC7|nr:ISAs1-like element ISCysp8 family transposase [Gloeothece citriformis]ACK72289.1 transposase ISAs1 family protein [Gloeothece citriformis PCC 7424]ACK73706.1 transposase ISAs1 family protein [Gloeothece citriformis PCC 7424]ACK73723.1 transposase ISAs1 family protein [Gloeothece citriformis PCC 7424]ACK73863.1 transposase ISAs1 family protein [Gloeothece citriformis PCC 7424]ACK73890.1 transposase ISAs1 family protein [Gloeothece citriformis PCC 7424]